MRLNLFKLSLPFISLLLTCCSQQSTQHKKLFTAYSTRDQIQAQTLHQTSATQTYQALLAKPVIDTSDLESITTQLIASKQWAYANQLIQYLPAQSAHTQWLHVVMALKQGSTHKAQTLIQALETQNTQAIIFKLLAQATVYLEERSVLALDSLHQAYTQAKIHGHPVSQALHDLLWQTLYDQPLRPHSHPHGLSWSSLQTLIHQHTNQPSRLIENLQQWLNNHPDQPASPLIKNALTHLSQPLEPISRIQLMLPKHKPLQKIQDHIIDGIIDGNQNTDKPMTLSINEQSTSDDPQAFQIGPLQQEAIQASLSQPHQAPKLLLSKKLSHPHQKVFTLDPGMHKEIPYLVHSLLVKGMNQPLIIASIDNPFREIAEEFNGYYHHSSYPIIWVDPKESMKTIAEALAEQAGIKNSHERHQQLQTLLQQPIKMNQPTPHHAFDSIFISAPNQTIQHIISLIDYHQIKVPLYSTSNINNRMGQSINHHNSHIHFFDTPSQLKPNSNTTKNSFYELGQQAISAAPMVALWLHWPCFQIKQPQGQLSLGENQSITPSLIEGVQSKGHIHLVKDQTIKNSYLHHLSDLVLTH